MSYPVPVKKTIELQVKVASTGTTGLAIQQKCSNWLCLWMQPKENSTIWKTGSLTPERELHHQHASCLVPESALPFVTSLKTQEKQRGEEDGR